MAEPLRVVIDMNVLGSAAIADGAPRRIVELVAAGAVRMVTCPRLHDELEGVLARERFLRRHRRRHVRSAPWGRSSAEAVAAEGVVDVFGC
jgi:predicted nucleic acid-binding protein